MGVGFDFFKATIGHNLANGVMDSLSEAIANNAAENSAREEAKKANSYKNDLLKTLVFMPGNNTVLERSAKKTIAEYLSGVCEESVSLFSIEDKIDLAYEKINADGPRKFFSEIRAINSDREQVVAIYTCVLILYEELANSEKVLPAHIYNMALIKHFFALTRKELTECYDAVAKANEADIDDIADLFESMTSEEAIKAIEAANPTLVYTEDEAEDEDEIEDEEPEVEEEPPQETSEPDVCANPREEIERLYYEALKEAGTAGKDFKDKVCLADSNPYFVSKAVNLYAKDCVGEDALLVFDNTWTKNFKNGFLLTNKNLYIGQGGRLKAKIALEQIKFIDMPANDYKIVVNTTDFPANMILPEGATALANYLVKVIPLAMQIGCDDKSEQKQLEEK